jgi:hypothetical protein
VSRSPSATDEPSDAPSARRRVILVAASVWLLVCVVLGILQTADQLNAPIRPLLNWAGILAGSH